MASEDLNIADLIKEKGKQGAPNALQETQTQLTELRKRLDANKITFGDYIKQAEEARLAAAPFEMQMGGTGSRGADAARQYQQSFQEISGLSQDLSKPGEFIYKPNAQLSKKYQSQIRESLLPDNITPEEREEFLNSIPKDIEYGSDRYEIEREGIRQKLAAKKTLEEQKGIQKTRLGDLATLLANQEQTSFNQNIPEIAEDAQSQGFLETSGFGGALAKERARLATNTQTVLGLQGLADRDFEVNSVGEIASNMNQYQSSGLGREFGVADQTRQEALAREIARMSQPKQPKGPSDFETGLQLALGGASAYGSIASGKGGKKV